MVHELSALGDRAMTFLKNIGVHVNFGLFAVVLLLSRRYHSIRWERCVLALVLVD
jgi:hypothetical protein